ncbi:MAG: DUF3460 family protein [Betaproteobacteria bacterium]|nr:DUF3460 family protein [Betaproteobacteria bacterium]MBI2961049.1 DUF3460 family protein [Betaproteobacteria bacterium]
MAKYYESDATVLIRELLKENPHIVEEQKKGRSLWWDRERTQDEIKRAEESKVKQRAYVY